LIDLLAVYLAGTAVAAASPTPGNIGAVEITLSAGLTTVGVPSAAAVAAVLVYRLLTFWFPLVPGFFAFRYLQAQRRI
jgi:glycosyltransferase 2 family protein